ncbi:Glycerol-3-phosphate phosphatase [Halotydeus destructor]|nr:Glycerol-3-phosphate phosphatase [Halotydeus destructor]
MFGLGIVVLTSSVYLDAQDKLLVVVVWMVSSIAIFFIIVHLCKPEDSNRSQLSMLKITVLILFVFIGLKLLTPLQRSSNQVRVLDSKVKVQELFRHVDTVLLDFDGTIIGKNESPVDGAAQFVNALKGLGKNVLIVTNNVMLSRLEILNILESAGVSNISLDKIYTSASVTAIYVKQKMASGAVYVFDSYQFANELDLLNMSHIGTGPDVGDQSSEFIPLESELDSNVEAVFIHTDKYVNQRKLSKAITYAAKVEPDLLIALDGQPPVSNNSWRLPSGGH